MIIMRNLQGKGRAAIVGGSNCLRRYPGAAVYLVTEASLRLRARNLVWIAFRLLAVL
jgi:hypothetical protein